MREKQDETFPREKRPKKEDKNSYIILGAIIGFAAGLLGDHPAIGMLIGVIIGKLLYDAKNKD